MKLHLFFCLKLPIRHCLPAILSLQVVKMVLKAVRVSDALNHRDLVQEHATLSTSPSSFTKGQILQPFS